MNNLIKNIVNAMHSMVKKVLTLLNPAKMLLKTGTWEQIQIALSLDILVMIKELVCKIW